MRHLFLVAMTVLGLAGCGHDSQRQDDRPPPQPFQDAGACGATAEQHPPDPGIHVDECTPLTWSTNPPSSGKHYPRWAAFHGYDTPVPRGYWVHDLEHGAVVVSYRCDEGCADLRARLAAWIAALPPDPGCADTRRVVVTPDPLLDAPVAASAWGWTLRASCFDEATFTQFFVDHVGMGPEQVCADGIDPPACP